MTPKNSDPKCPQCGKPLEKVRYPSDSMFNREQWDSMRAGDWYCESCPYNGRAKNPKGAYFWDSEVGEPVAEPQGSTKDDKRIAHLESECRRLDADGDKWMHRAAIAEQALEDIRTNRLPEPGSSDALALGCRCPESKLQPARRKNNPKLDWMCVNPECPIHGWRVKS